MTTITSMGAKGGGDFLRLRFWGTVLLMLGALLALGAGSAHAAPLAGTSIGNQASARYNDSNGVDRVTVSNTVSTIVQSVGSATMTQSQTKIGAPGQSVSFPHTIVNNGNSADTFTVTIGAQVNNTGNAFSTATTGGAVYADANCDGQADSNTTTTTLGPVAPGGQICFVVQASLSTNAGDDSQFPVNFASSVAGATLTGNPNTDRVSISANAVIGVTKSISIATGPKGTIVTYQLTYRNTGTISAGRVVVADTLPAGATYIAGSGRWSVSTSTPLTDVATDTEGGGTLVTQIDYGTSGTATGGSVVAIIGQVDPGVQGTVQFQAQMNGATTITNNQARWCYSDIGVNGTIQPTGSNADCTAIRATFGATDLSGVTANIASLTNLTTGTGFPSNIVPFTIPTVGATGSLVYNDNNGSNTDGTNPGNVTAAQALPDSSVDIAVATAGQGTLATWDTFVWNTGGSSDTFNVFAPTSGATVSNFPTGTTFLLFRSDRNTPLTDSNNDGILDTGPVAAGASYLVHVVAVLPPSGIAGTYDAILTAQSTNTTTATNTVGVRARIVGSTVDIRNYNTAGANGYGGGTGFGEGAAVTTMAANPGTIATFGLTVVNTGSVADSYNLAYNVGTGNYNLTQPYAFVTPGVLPNGFSVAFYRDNGTSCTTAQLGAQVANTGVIAPGASVNVCALVTIPNGASVVTYQLFFRALSPTTFSGVANTSSGDVKRDALSVNQYRSVAITPNNSGQIFPGGSIQYCHTVTNAGNASETLAVSNAQQSLFAASAGGWVEYATVYVDTNKNCVIDAGENGAPLSVTLTGLNGVYTAGETRNFIVVVQAPTGAAPGQTNVNTFTLTGGPSTQVATDTTTVVVGQVNLVKEQVLDPSTTCATAMTLGGAGALTYSQTQITTGATPGRCIIYRVTATNVGTQAVTNAIIYDVAPPNTLLNGTQFCNTTLQPTCTATNPSGQNVQSAVGASLAPGATHVLFFRVRIDP